MSPSTHRALTHLPNKRQLYEPLVVVQVTMMTQKELSQRLKEVCYQKLEISD